ncbi:MAG: hypothetical protein HY318_19410 [Armatimonadetes bacterium]|nr:hypothetical protein [Armatimonadota bacterium]
MSTQPSNKQTLLKAGVAKVDITCEPGGTYDALLPEKAKKHIPREYLGSRLIVDDPLSARVLVLDDAGTLLVLVTMDVTAIGARSISQDILSDSADDFMPNLRARLAAEFDIPGANVSVCASHVHQTPRMLCDDAAQIERIAAAVGEALRNMTPVTVGVGTGRENTITFNRTIMLKNGTDHTLPPYPREEDIAGLRPVDPEIGILRIDRLDGHPLAVVYNFASHVLLGSPQGNQGHVTADHVGVTRQYLEEAIGGGAMAFFLQGAHGDVNEVSVGDHNNRNRVREFGTKLGLSVLAGYSGITAGPGTLAVATRSVAFPLRKDIPDCLARLEQQQDALRASLNTAYAYLLSFKEFLPLYLRYALSPEYPSHPSYRYLKAAECGDGALDEEDRNNRLEIEKYLERIQIMEEMTRNELKISMLKKHQEVIEGIGAPTIGAEIKGLKIGDAVLIAAPMEMLTEVGLNVKKMSPFPHTYVVSLANGYLHYAAPASYYPRGGYEVNECLLAPEWEGVFMSAVQCILDEL